MQDLYYEKINNLPGVEDDISQASNFQMAEVMLVQAEKSPKPIEKVKEIAEVKMRDLNAFDIENAMSMVAGTARSMGLTVED